MNRKWLIPAGIFLAIALIVPPYILITQSDKDIDNLISEAPNLADETQTQGIIADLQEQHMTVFIIVIAIEVIAVILAAVCLWLALRP